MEGEPISGIPGSIKSSYCFVLQAMRIINGDNSYNEFRNNSTVARENKTNMHNDGGDGKPYEHWGPLSSLYDGSGLIGPDFFRTDSDEPYLDFVGGLRNLSENREFRPEDDAADFLRQLKKRVDESTSIERSKANIKTAADTLLRNIEESSPAAQAEDTAQNLATETEEEKEIKELIETGRCYQIIFTGAPGTGKTFIAKRVAEMGKKLTWLAKDGKAPKYQLVQFHPSYDYTDFVEGLRPVEAEESHESGVLFRRVDGIFKEFCRHVAKENKNSGEAIENERYFFIIDEINRANLSKVFGELMSCLERDKRGEKGKVQTQYRNLPTYALKENKFAPIEDDVFEDGFYIPENVVILGTMNDIDRSVDTMDFALRRRFEWREFKVSEDSLRKAFEAVDEDGKAVFGAVIKNNAGDLAVRVEALNQVIKDQGKALGLTEPEHYCISQGQFANLREDIRDSGPIDKIRQYAWNYRLEYLLREYVRGEDAKAVEAFIAKAAEEFGVSPDIG